MKMMETNSQSNNLQSKWRIPPQLGWLCLSAILLLFGQVRLEAAENGDFAAQLQTIQREKGVKRQQAIATLRAMGSPAIAQLVEALRHEDATIRSSAAFVLGSFGPEAAAAIPELVNTLHDKNKFVREDAAAALRRVGEAAIAPLTEALADERVEVRRCAAFALAGIGSSAVEAIPALLAQLDDEDERARFHAAIALRAIGKPAESKLMKALQDKSERIRRGAAFALGKVGSPHVIPLSETLTEIQQRQKVGFAWESLAQLGKNERIKEENKEEIEGCFPRSCDEISDPERMRPEICQLAPETMEEGELPEICRGLPSLEDLRLTPPTKPLPDEEMQPNPCEVSPGICQIDPNLEDSPNPCEVSPRSCETPGKGLKGLL
jgi:hypothetical protein